MRFVPGRAEAASGVGVISSQVVAVVEVPRRLQNRLLSATVAGTGHGEAPAPEAWHAFAPLAVGDRRIVRWTNGPGVTGYAATEVMDEQTVGGVAYMRVQQTTYDDAAIPTATGTTTTLERYSDDLGCVVSRETGGTACTPFALGGMRTLVRTATVDVSGQSIETRTIEDGGNSGNTSVLTQYAEGLGLILSRYSPGSPSATPSTTDLIYARIDGIHAGVEPSWVMWPVAGESDPEPLAALALRLAGANPTAGTVRLRASSAEARTAWLTVSDVLGRVIEARDVTLASGTTEVRIDLGGHAAGLYRVQVRASAAVSVTLR